MTGEDPQPCMPAFCPTRGLDALKAGDCASPAETVCVYVCVCTSRSMSVCECACVRAYICACVRVYICACRSL